MTGCPKCGADAVYWPEMAGGGIFGFDCKSLQNKDGSFTQSSECKDRQYNQDMNTAIRIIQAQCSPVGQSQEDRERLDRFFAREDIQERIRRMKG